MKVVYLTGAPAAGKSTTLRLLKKFDPSILCISYGAELTKYIQQRDASSVSQQDLRARSAGIIRPEDIKALDTSLLNSIELRRGKCPIIIDSHPVTKEDFGFRVTAFSLSSLRRLSPDEIWVLYAAPEVICKRIHANPEGRPSVTKEQIRMHTNVQSSVAATYGVISDAPVYLFDTDREQEALAQDLLKRLKK
tara:strand:+ start:580 stop:1158 length:579 start_codon:yes stop_codon:yes gene_type:complete